MYEVANSPRTAVANDLKIKPAFSLTNFKSNAASKTIKASPTTPNIFKIEKRFGLPISEIKKPKFISIPVKINIKTEGTPDFLEYRLKK
jgi:hypothetical protein